MRKRLFNESKLRVLTSLDSARAALTLRELAEGLGQEIGTVYGCAARLRRQGLVGVAFDGAGVLRYQITRKGRVRLAWLRAR
jgi:DNA-binding IclR family transcriptional regulator